MQNASSWLDYASSAIALVALLVSVQSMRRQGSRVVGVYERAEKTPPSGPIVIGPGFPYGEDVDDVYITLTNRGLAYVYVQAFVIEIRRIALFPIFPLMFTRGRSGRTLFLVEGPELPAKLDSQSTATWLLRPSGGLGAQVWQYKSMLRRGNRLVWNRKLTAVLGNGQTIKVKKDKSGGYNI
ncbi:MAG: hypothetical protein AB7I38_15680 [Dehalococcoidia bacterium]